MRKSYHTTAVTDQGNDPADRTTVASVSELIRFIGYGLRNVSAIPVCHVSFALIRVLQPIGAIAQKRTFLVKNAPPSMSGKPSDRSASIEGELDVTPMGETGPDGPGLP